MLNIHIVVMIISFNACYRFSFVFFFFTIQAMRTVQLFIKCFILNCSALNAYLRHSALSEYTI